MHAATPTTEQGYYSSYNFVEFVLFSHKLYAVMVCIQHSIE